MTVNVLCLFLTVSLVYLQCVIVVFPDHTHLLFSYLQPMKMELLCGISSCQNSNQLRGMILLGHFDFGAFLFEDVILGDVSTYFF